jgi:hypothetical protein
VSMACHFLCPTLLWSSFLKTFEELSISVAPAL